MTKIVNVDEKLLRKIIREELEAEPPKNTLNHEEAVSIVSAASKLLGAVEAFEEKAPQSAKDLMASRVPDLRKALEDMVTNPGAYVSRVNPQNVKVSDTAQNIVDPSPAVTASPAGKKPVLDHKTATESINRRLRQNAKNAKT